MKETLLKVQDLSIGFHDDEDGLVAITDRLNFELKPGEILGLVGESGCGKTVTALALLRLLPQPAGQIIQGSVEYRGRDILSMNTEEVRALRGNDLAMIFQEPSAAMNPLMTVEKQLLELFDYHEYQGDPDSRIQELLHRVGFPDPGRILKAYPHELSGGMLQRVMIALALLLKPDIIIADEPTTALDVTVQAQIMELLVELQREEKSSIILITHNLSLVAQYADRLAVMYAGRIVETGPVDDFLANPLHPYSKGLLGALPDFSRLNTGDRRLTPIDGSVPAPRDFPEGCRFAERCKQAFDACQQRPGFYASKSQPEHQTACFLMEQEVAAPGGAS